MSNEADEHGDVRSLIGALTQSVAQAEPDDLGGLAKMHSWCESLAGIKDDDVPAQVSEAAKSVVHLLEAIILGEASDPAGMLKSIVEQIGELAQLAGGENPGADGIQTHPSCDEAAVPGGDAEPGEEEVARKLAGVFEEEPAAAESAQVAQNTGAELAEDSVPAEADAGVEPPYEPQPLEIDEKEFEFVRGFVEEANEHIEASEAALLEIERTPEDSSAIDNLFRPFHTIKGMAGFLNLRDVGALTHEVETLLDQGRKGQRKITPGVIDLMFDVLDILKAQVGSIGVFIADPKPGPVSQPPIVEMIDNLRAVVAGRVEPEGRQPVGGGAEQKVGENLVDQGACGKAVVDFALEKQRQTPGTKTGEIIAKSGAATHRQVSQAIRVQKQPSAPGGGAASPTAPDQSVRIDTGKLDALVDMVGELVIAQTLVNASPAIATDPKLAKDTGQVAKIVREVQEVAMSMRMVPIASTFQRMARLVRDVSRKGGKRVELHISGEDTEIDKNVIQQIGDPLVHMIRNAVDHGVEDPDTRRAAGKEETGHVHLSASHQGGNIVIEISDDGKGMDAKALIAKGIEKGLVQPGEELTDAQAYGLIFAPGFSLAKQITDISGRGVGMDVVRRNIEQLRGKVDISSELGKGSTFSIRLPLTLAIIDGMMIQIAGERFIIPTISIEQALRPEPDMITSVQQRGEVLNVRGRLIPLIQLGALFGLTGRVNPCDVIVVIAHCEGRQIGLVVDALLEQQQVVIKSLGERFQKLKGVAGAAILGDGRVGLILEMSGLAAVHEANETVFLPRPEEVSGNDAVSQAEPPEGGPEQAREAEPPQGVASEQDCDAENVLVTT